MAVAGKPRILVVDDEEDVLVLLKKRFAREDWDVIEARDGQQALLVAQKNKPDLILLDIIMPKVDGYHACFAMKGHPEISNVPIIMLTAKTQPFEKVKGQMVGADEYICKPFDLDELVSTIRRHLGNTITTTA
jgi:two-component system, OmpR family, phosphate regulon response regulator PhoB